MSCHNQAARVSVVARVKNLISSTGFDVKRTSPMAGEDVEIGRMADNARNKVKRSLVLVAGFGLLSLGLLVGRHELGFVPQHRMHDDYETTRQSDARLAHRQSPVD